MNNRHANINRKLFRFLITLSHFRQFQFFGKKKTILFNFFEFGNLEKLKLETF